MRITCVHQGYELYGSDRCFVESVDALRTAYPLAEIDVVLPREGPICSVLAPYATRLIIEPLWVLRRRDLRHLLTAGLARLPGAVGRAVARMRASDLVYINTSVVADYLLAARFFSARTVVHVHEIPQGPVMAVLRSIIRWSGATVIFNSQATRAAFNLPDRQPSHVIYNGIDGPARVEPVLYDGRRPLRLLMLGRISRIKGQDVLIKAIAALPSAIRDRIELRIVGSAFEDKAKERMLRNSIVEAGLTSTISISPFTPDPTSFFQWADVVTVPSRLPESLGRVAIEAMAFGRPPLASAIGGLREVVEHERTGWLVAPDQAAPLAALLQQIVEKPEAWSAYGAAARARYEMLFSKTSAVAAIAEAAHAVLHRADAAAANAHTALAGDRA